MATATPVSQAVAEWTRIFPRQVTENYTSSVTFMKQLTLIAVSAITYLKNAFPEDSYTSEKYAGLNLKILKKKCKDEMAQFLSTALSQAFDAFDKRYLHQLAICFYENECKAENLIEYHLFEYTYTPGGVTVDLRVEGKAGTKKVSYSFDNVRDQTLKLIKTCVVLTQGSQQELPASYDVSIRLYYNDDAPEDYQAPGFLSTSSETVDHLLPTMNDKFRFGTVNTNYHKVVGKSYVKEKVSSHEANASQNPPTMTPGALPGTRSIQSIAIKQQFVCPCNMHEHLKTETGVLLTCTYCNRQQHGVCFGLFSLPTDIEHCCTSCSDADHSKTPTDAKLASLQFMKRECLCIFRLALAWCSHRTSIDGRSLMDIFNISAINAGKLIKLLHSHGIIQNNDADLTKPLKIVLERLKFVMNKFFRTNAEEDIVDRLVAESLESQELQSDPVGDVLGHMEKVKLQNESNIGRVIKNDITNPTVVLVHNSTLAQYREAILSNEKMEEEEELPLSGSHNPINVVNNIGKKKAPKRPKLQSAVKTKKARAK